MTTYPIKLNEKQAKAIYGIVDQWIEDEEDLWGSDPDDHPDGQGGHLAEMRHARAMLEVLDGSAHRRRWWDKFTR